MTEPAECGFTIYRGQWYIGPCHLDFGHDGEHDPYTKAERAAMQRPVVVETIKVKYIRRETDRTR